jgi:hypothetical protein
LDSVTSTENGVESRSAVGKEHITDPQDKRREPKQAQAVEGEAAESRWKPLFRIAGAAALITAVLTPIAIAVFAIWPPPYEGTAEDWFSLFQDNWLLGLLSLDLPFVVINILMIPIMLALYVCLRRVSPSLMALAVAIFLVGVAAFFASNPSVEMLSLSNRYAEAATEVGRLSLLGAGEAMLATFQGTAFHVNYILAQIAGIVIGAVMLRTTIFSRWIGYLMIGGNALGFGLYVPAVGLVLSAFSGVILWVWFILIARRFFQLGRTS